MRECPGGEHRSTKAIHSRGGRSVNAKTSARQTAVAEYGFPLGRFRPADRTAVRKPAFSWTWRKPKRIPSDTLASFDPVYGRIHFFHPRRDAFEVLKNSGLMSSVPDKDFLLAVTQGYAVLADLEENISMYYQLKLTAQNDMSKDFSEKQRERFYTGDMYERWECIFSVPCFAEFMLTAPYYFPEGYIEGLLADVDRSIRAIEAKYKLDKKPTDD